jgi:ring-1,2-phenylacetyl-CoA epoxidase subunit PaaD
MKHIKLFENFNYSPVNENVIIPGEYIDFIQMLKDKGIDSAKVELVLATAWSTDWLSDNGRIKLSEYGIAPPEHEVDKSVLFAEPTVVPCPKCHSRNTRMVSQFGSTACKALYQCNECQEPYDYFKCLK